VKLNKTIIKIVIQFWNIEVTYNTTL